MVKKELAHVDVLPSLFLFFFDEGHVFESEKSKKVFVSTSRHAFLLPPTSLTHNHHQSRM